MGLSAARLGREAARHPDAQDKPVASRRRHTLAGSELGCAYATSVADERSILAAHAAASREGSNLHYSITNRCLALVRGQDPARLPPSSETLACAGEIGGSSLTSNYVDNEPVNNPVNHYDEKVELGSEIAVRYAQIRDHKNSTELRPPLAPDDENQIEHGQIEHGQDYCSDMLLRIYPCLSQ
jgi:hypothetical protein